MWNCAAGTSEPFACRHLSPTLCVCVSQVAQQEVQRAAFIVERAIQERQQKIVQAEGETEAAEMISFITHIGCIAQLSQLKLMEIVHL